MSNDALNKIESEMLSVVQAAQDRGVTVEEFARFAFECWDWQLSEKQRMDARSWSKILSK